MNFILAKQENKTIYINPSSIMYVEELDLDFYRVWYVNKLFYDVEIKLEEFEKLYQDPQ